MDPKCRKGILLKTGVNEGGFWEPPNLPDRPLLYRLLTFSVKRSVACVAREIQSAALEIWRSHAIFQAPRPPLSTGSCTAGTSANFIFLKCGFPLPFVCLVVVVVVFVFYYFLWSVKVIEKGDLRLVAFLWNDPDKELIWNHSDLYSQTRHTHMSNALVSVSSDCIMERSDH